MNQFINQLTDNMINLYKFVYQIKKLESSQKQLNKYSKQLLVHLADNTLMQPTILCFLMQAQFN